MSSPSAPVLLIDIADRIATLTMNRPAQRNALSSELIASLRAQMTAAEENPDVDVIILTGTDPAFCAGLDLNELGSTGITAAGGGRPWNPTTKPVIGAINGVAVTGGFELALNCDFLIASEFARFADTHTRVGILPGWGLSVLLPQAIGLRRAKEMSLTGNYLGAEEALQFGLVNRVVPHADLLPTCRRLAADIVGNDQAAVRMLRASYDAISEMTVGAGWEHERTVGRAWARRPDGGPADVEARRMRVIERGRAQQRPS